MLDYEFYNEQMICPPGIDPCRGQIETTHQITHIDYTGMNGTYDLQYFSLDENDEWAPSNPLEGDGCGAWFFPVLEFDIPYSHMFSRVSAGCRPHIDIDTSGDFKLAIDLATGWLFRPNYRVPLAAISRPIYFGAAVPPFPSPVPQLTWDRGIDLFGGNCDTQDGTVWTGDLHDFPNYSATTWGKFFDFQTSNAGVFTPLLPYLFNFRLTPWAFVTTPPNPGVNANGSPPAFSYAGVPGTLYSGLDDIGDFRSKISHDKVRTSYSTAATCAPISGNIEGFTELQSRSYSHHIRIAYA